MLGFVILVFDEYYAIQVGYSIYLLGYKIFIIIFFYIFCHFWGR